MGLAHYWGSDMSYTSRAQRDEAEANRAAVLAMIHKHGQTTMSEASKALGLRPAQINHLLKTLRDRGFIRLLGEGSSRVWAAVDRNSNDVPEEYLGQPSIFHVGMWLQAQGRVQLQSQGAQA